MVEDATETSSSIDPSSYAFTFRILFGYSLILLGLKFHEVHTYYELCKPRSPVQSSADLWKFKGYIFKKLPQK